nr:hypothetical protein CFP56_57946 [Quercus suber]
MTIEQERAQGASAVEPIQIGRRCFRQLKEENGQDRVTREETSKMFCEASNGTDMVLSKPKLHRIDIGVQLITAD